VLLFAIGNRFMNYVCLAVDLQAGVFLAKVDGTMTDSIQFLKTKGVTNNQLQQGQPELASNLLSLFDESSLPEFVKAVTRQKRTLQIF